MTERHFRRASNASSNKHERSEQPPVSLNAYDKYKAALHAIFDGKAPIPEHIQRLAPDRESDGAAHADATPANGITVKDDRRGRKLPSPSSNNNYAVLMDTIRHAATSEEISKAIDSLIAAGHVLPADEELLSKALCHNDESIVAHALNQLRALLSLHSAKSPRLLKTRIDNVSLMASSQDTRALCLELRQLVS